MIDVDCAARFGETKIHASFCAGEGVTALFGASGAGKSTIVKMIAGLVTPVEGRIKIGDELLFDHARGVNVPSERRRIGCVFQEPRLFPHVNVKANLTFARWAGRGPSARKLAEIVELLGLEALLERRPMTLSGGERQRVAIGRALLSAPRALLMDEPLASLDASRKAEILPYLERLRRELRLPVLYVSHALDEVARLAATLVIVKNGETPVCGPVGDVMARLELGGASAPHDVGALLTAVVEGYDPRWRLSHLRIGEHVLQVPGEFGPVGAALRLQARARDVSLARARPDQVSIRNILPVLVEAVKEGEGAYADVLCRFETQVLRARITRASVAELELEPGVRAFALLKTVAIDERPD